MFAVAVAVVLTVALALASCRSGSTRFSYALRFDSRLGCLASRQRIDFRKHLSREVTRILWLGDYL